MEHYRTDGIQDEDEDLIPILKYLRFKIEGLNILHFYNNNLEFLKAFMKEISVQFNELENEDALNYIYYVLYPNNMEFSPFHIALKKSYSPKCIE